MKRNIFSACILGITLSFTACTTKDLVFPESSPNETETGVIDVIVKPQDVKVEGSYDNTFYIKWPRFSDKIAKVILMYQDNGNEITKEITDFTKDLEIITATVDEYTFTLTSVAKDGRETSPVSIKATNKGLYVEELLERSSVTSEGRYVKVSMPNPLKSKIKYHLTYAGSNGDIDEVIESLEENADFTFNGAFGDKVNIVIEDDKGNKVSKQEEYVIMPKSYSTATDKVLWTPYTNTPDRNNPGWSQANVLNGTTNEYGGLLRMPSGQTISTNYIHFTRGRVNSSSLYDADDQRHPQGPFDKIFITAAVFYINYGTVFGTTPTGIEVFGVKEDRTEVLIKTITGNTLNMIRVDFDDKAEQYIGIRYNLTGFTGASNNCEVNIEGYAD